MAAPSSSSRDRERREVASPSTLQQQQMQLLELQLLQKRHKQQQQAQQAQQKHIKEEYSAGQRGERPPPSYPPNSGQWSNRQPSCVSVDSIPDRRVEAGSVPFKKYDQQLPDAPNDSSKKQLDDTMLNSSNDDEQGQTWYEDLSNTSSV